MFVIRASVYATGVPLIPFSTRVRSHRQLGYFGSHLFERGIKRIGFVGGDLRLRHLFILSTNVNTNTDTDTNINSYSRFHRDIYHNSRAAMSTQTQARDVSSQSDISKMKTDSDGSFKRKPSTFRNTIEKGGRFEPERGRYHLYVSYACREWFPFF